MIKNVFLLIVILVSLGNRGLQAQACQNDTIFSDVIFLIDDSGSIDDAEFAAFSNIILTTINDLQAECPEAAVGVVHYGGTNGQETTVEYSLSSSNIINSISRQYCTARNASNICIGDGGDDLNHAVGFIMGELSGGSLNHNTDNTLSLVILTDAFGFDTNCGQPNCSLILPTTNIDNLKSAYDADVSVVGMSSQAEESLLSIYASPGGDYTGTLFPAYCAGSFDGCAGPRKYVEVDFNSDPDSVSAIISNFVSCTIIVNEGLIAEAGMSQTVCGDLSQIATLTASASMGAQPYSYLWSHGAGSDSSVMVMPGVTTNYFVTVTDFNNCTAVDSVLVVVEDCCSTFSVDAGLDTSICTNLGESTTIMAAASGSGSGFMYTWNNGLGAGASHTVSPSVTTTYEVTASDNNGCMAMDQVTVTAASCAPNCDADTTFSDVIFLVDNSGSIDDGEFATFENIILESLNGIRTSCASSKRSVVHYGGTNGTSTIVEYSLGQVSQITDINRQFCTARDGGGLCIGGGGDDLNNAIGDIMTFLNDGTINRDPSNQLSLVIFTDAFGFDTTCGQPNCSLILPTTNIDLMKSNYGVDVSVVGVSSQAEEVLLGIYASPGGTFNSNLYQPECAGSFDGCTLPRKYVQIEFNTPPQDVSDMITSFVECSVEVAPKLIVDAGEDQTICTNLGEMATLTAQVDSGMGVPPYIYQWSDGLGTMQSVDVMPMMSHTYYVTATDANLCMAVDSVMVNGIECAQCLADAGMPQPLKDLCLENGQAFLPTESNTGTQIPMGFEEVFILTNQDLVILDYSIGFTNFIVNEEGLYRIHTLIAEVSNSASEDYFDLSIIIPNESQLFLIVNCIENHDICAAFDFAGRVHQVFGPNDMMCMTFENSINLCMDGIDNDGDGLVDCADEDCKELVNCEESTLLACNDLTDNDGDGLVDCFDPDCFGFTVCFERGDKCNDGIDNDGDGLVDCADNSCDGSAPCEENSPFTCVDGRDNDGDGLTDCHDTDCQRFIVCAEYTVEACQDGKDNDYDGLVDCADYDCKEILGEDICNPDESTFAKCSDGEDNDGDGLVDCADPDCRTNELLDVEANIEVLIRVTHATCPDNDNGSIRFIGIANNPNYQYSIDGGETYLSTTLFTGLEVGEYNVAIKSEMGCALIVTADVRGQACIEICHNGIDDDSDGLVDCADDQCSGVVDPYSPQIVNLIGADCPDFNNGTFSISGVPGGVQYSIDGINYQSLPKFSSLQEGTYNLSYRDQNGCYPGISVTIPVSEKICIPAEICNNGIDDDQDGLTDCHDVDDCPGMDSDGDGICNNVDECPSFDNSLLGTPCDDLSECTENDVYTTDCECAGTRIDSDGDGICDFEDNCPLIFGTLCPEICNNGLDDDGDGLIDCEDVDDCLFNGLNIIDFKSSMSDGTDAHVVNKNTTSQSNFGTSTFLISQEGELSTGDPYHGHTFINFPIETIFSVDGIMLDSASITLYSDIEAEQTGNNASLIHLISEPWDENTITYNNRPDYNPDFFLTINRSNDFDKINIDVLPLLEKVIEEELSYYGFIVQPREKTPTRSMVFASSESLDQARTPEVYVAYRANCLVDEICNNGVDDDGDGLTDCVDDECCGDLSCQSQSLEFDIVDSSCDANTGQVIIRNPDSSVQYFTILNGGEAYSIDAANLTPGDYTLFALGICDTVEVEIVIGYSEVCVTPEDCTNGTDDDGDGLVDCDDPDCSNAPECQSQGKADWLLLTPYTVYSFSESDNAVVDEFVIPKNQGSLRADAFDYFNNEIWIGGVGLSDKIIGFDDSTYALKHRIEHSVLNQIGQERSLVQAHGIFFDGEYWWRSIGISLSKLDACGNILENRQLLHNGIRGIFVEGDWLYYVSSISDVVKIARTHLTTDEIEDLIVTDHEDAQAFTLTDDHFIIVNEQNIIYKYNRVTLQLDEEIPTGIEPNFPNEIAGIRSANSRQTTPFVTCSEDCYNNIDDDGDGLIDSLDNDCLNMVERVFEITNPSCGNMNDGVIFLTNELEEDRLYSDDDHRRLTNPLNNLSPGEYSFNISYPTFNEPYTFTLVAPVCPDEICDNGIDDDGDGLVDCADDDCGTDEISLYIDITNACSGRNTGVLDLSALPNSGDYSYTLSKLNHSDTLEAVADAFTNPCIPDTTFGTRTYMTVSAWTYNGSGCNLGCVETKAYINFDWDELPQGALIHSASLSFTASETNPGRNCEAGLNTSIVSRITSDWSENLLSHNSGTPNTTSENAAIIGSLCSAGDLATVDVTELVKNIYADRDGSFGFELSLEEPDCYMGYNFGSHEAGNPVEIFIDYSYPHDPIYQDSPIFSNLVAGEYELLVHVPEGCIYGYEFEISADNCSDEICNNGMDDDGDGLVDCADDDCCGDVSCGILGSVQIETTAAACPDNNNGELTIITTAPTLEYSLDGVFFDSSTGYNNLDSGTHTLYIREENGCVNSTSFIINGETGCMSDVFCDTISHDGMSNVNECLAIIDFSGDRSLLIGTSLDDLLVGDVVLYQDAIKDCDGAQYDAIITIETIVGVRVEAEDTGINLYDARPSLDDYATFSIKSIISGSATHENVEGVSANIENLVLSQQDVDSNTGVDYTEIVGVKNSVSAPDSIWLIDSTKLEEAGFLNGGGPASGYQIFTMFPQSGIGDYTDNENAANHDDRFSVFMFFESFTEVELLFGVTGPLMEDVGIRLTRVYGQKSCDSSGLYCNDIEDCPVVDCSSFVPVYDEIFTTDAVCLDDGIVDIFGADATYVYSLDGVDYISAEEGGLIYGDLFPGMYQLHIRNVDSCVAIIDIEVGGESCNVDCSGNPDYTSDGLVDSSYSFTSATTCEVCIIGFENQDFGTDEWTECNLNLNSGRADIRDYWGANGSTNSLFLKGFRDTLNFNEQIILHSMHISFEASTCGQAEMIGFNGGFEVFRRSINYECRDECTGEVFSELGFTGMDTIDRVAFEFVDCDCITSMYIDDMRTQRLCEETPAASKQTAELNINVMLQGACTPDGGLMKTDLNDGGYLPGQEPETYFGLSTPAGQPFNQAPWFYEGEEGLNMKSNNKSDEPIYDARVVDWVLVSLRMDAAKPSEVWRGAGLLYNDGSISLFNPVEMDQISKDGYYVVVEHRNHLPVMSDKKVQVNEGAITYDFTASDSYSSIIGIGQMQDEFGRYVMVAGNGELIVELSSDIDINARDLTLWLQNNGANSSYFLEDYDMNGDINIKDRILWEKNNGLFTTLQTK